MAKKSTRERARQATEQRAIARDWLASNVRWYQETRNPIYAWEAYLDARQAGVPIPDSVLDYFDRCAMRIFRVTRRQRAFAPKLTAGMTEAEWNAAIDAPDPVTLDDVSKAVALAMEFISAGKNGPGNKLRAHLDISEEMKIAATMHFALVKAYRELQPHEIIKKGAIERAVAEECRVSASCVRAHYRKHAHLFPPHR